MIKTFAPGIQTLDCGQYLIGVCPGGESRWQVSRPEQPDHLGVVSAGDPVHRFLGTI
jgi:hypothetical protein